MANPVPVTNATPEGSQVSLPTSLDGGVPALVPLPLGTVVLIRNTGTVALVAEFETTGRVDGIALVNEYRTIPAGATVAFARLSRVAYGEEVLIHGGPGLEVSAFVAGPEGVIA